VYRWKSNGTCKVAAIAASFWMQRLRHLIVILAPPRFLKTPKQLEFYCNSFLFNFIARLYPFAKTHEMFLRANPVDRGIGVIFCKIYFSAMKKVIFTGTSTYLLVGIKG